MRQARGGRARDPTRNEPSQRPRRGTPHATLWSRATRRRRSGTSAAAIVLPDPPQTLYRHGVHDDTGHIQAKQAMARVHRHLLLVKDIVDVAAKNQAAIRRDSYGDYESGPSLPSSPVHADPNAGYGSAGAGAEADGAAAGRGPGETRLTGRTAGGVIRR